MEADRRPSSLFYIKCNFHEQKYIAPPDKSMTVMHINYNFVKPPQTSWILVILGLYFIRQATSVILWIKGGMVYLCFCFEHISLIGLKDKKQALTTYKFFSLNIAVIIMDINLGQKKIYYNIDVQKDKLYSNLKDSFINLCTDVPLKRSVFWRLKGHGIL